MKINEINANVKRNLNSNSIPDPQIHFHGKDKKSLLRHFDVDCLPTFYGGNVEIPEGTGVALGDLFRLYTKEFESKRPSIQLKCRHLESFEFDFENPKLKLFLSFFYSQWPIHSDTIHRLAIHFKHFKNVISICDSI